MISFTFRKQQIYYGIVLLLATLASAVCGIIGRFRDIEFGFSQDQRLQYNRLTTGVMPLFQTNIALIAFVAILILVDGLRSSAKGAIPVWFELVWTFVFGVIEIIDIVLLANNYPSLHCSPSVSSLAKRDSVDDSIIGHVASSTTTEKVVDGSKLICQNWAAMLSLVAIVAVLLFAQWFYLALLGLRHRLSNPDFFLMAETPAPFTWHLPASATSESKSSDAASVASSSFSTEKVQQMDVILGMPMPIQVRVQRTQVDQVVC